MSFAKYPWLAILASVLVTMPFFIVTIPPLTDVPGHMGSSAAAAYADDPAFRPLFGFHWHLLPNLGSEIVVAGLRPVIGITSAYWLIAALIPPLFALGIFMIAEVLNPFGAAAIPWALLFIYSYPFSYGFLNYLLGTALSLIGFAVWMRLDGRPRLREAATWIAVPLLFLCHAVAGCIFGLLICSRELSLLSERRRVWRLLGKVRPLLSSVVILVSWRLFARSFAGQNETSLHAKLNALVMLLRDQDRVLDEGSVAAALLVFVVGLWLGARPHRAVVPAILFLIPLFIVTPSTLSGSSFADERLLPLIPILAFATQDWSRVDVRLVRVVALSGLALFVGRLTLTAASFVAYDAQFSTDLAALRHVPDYSRIIVLNTRYCSARRHWRASRLGHLGDLAILYRRSWTNSEWDTDGAHLLQVRTRPSPRFYDDPSQYVWPTSCGGMARNHPTLEDVLPDLPYGKIDFLWLIDASLPIDYSDPRLVERWRNAQSALYSVRPAPHAH